MSVVEDYSHRGHLPRVNNGTRLRERYLSRRDLRDGAGQPPLLLWNLQSSGSERVYVLAVVWEL